jgi:hypothetical protein
MITTALKFWLWFLFLFCFEYIDSCTLHLAIATYEVIRVA